MTSWHLAVHWLLGCSPPLFINHLLSYSMMLPSSFCLVLAGMAEKGEARAAPLLLLPWAKRALSGHAAAPPQLPQVLPVSCFLLQNITQTDGPSFWVLVIYHLMSCSSEGTWLPTAVNWGLLTILVSVSQVFLTGCATSSL